MPYTSVNELPEPVKHSLPKHAQEIFKEAFNSAYEKDQGADEVRSFKIAWSAVKKTYEKRDKKWVRKTS
jgi:cation transport regulator